MNQDLGLPRLRYHVDGNRLEARTLEGRLVAARLLTAEDLERIKTPRSVICSMSAVVASPGAEDAPK